MTANINIEHVLERVKSDQIDVGAWINVIGYIQDSKELGIFVQAVAVWSAGNVDLEAYAIAVNKRKETA